MYHHMQNNSNTDTKKSPHWAMSLLVEALMTVEVNYMCLPWIASCACVSTAVILLQHHCSCRS